MRALPCNDGSAVTLVLPEIKNGAKRKKPVFHLSKYFKKRRKTQGISLKNGAIFTLEVCTESS
jgi:hypothetical protein